MATGSRLTALLATTLFALTALAHHSPAEFDTSRELRLTGTVLGFVWANPHTQTTVRAAGEDGTEAVWTLEGMSPDYLGRRGWNHYSLTVGEAIEVTVCPARDGSRRGLFLRATLPDRTVRIMFEQPR
jgi:hypothetical protein